MRGWRPPTPCSENPQDYLVPCLRAFPATAWAHVLFTTCFVFHLVTWVSAYLSVVTCVIFLCFAGKLCLQVSFSCHRFSGLVSFFYWPFLPLISLSKSYISEVRCSRTRISAYGFSRHIVFRPSYRLASIFLREILYICDENVMKGLNILYLRLEGESLSPAIHLWEGFDGSAFLNWALFSSRKEVLKYNSAFLLEVSVMNTLQLL